MGEPTGNLGYFEKMDGTQYASATISPEQARASAMYRRATKIFQDQANGGQPYIMRLPGVVASEGGLPLVEGGKLIGAIGMSGRLASGLRDRQSGGGHRQVDGMDRTGPPARLSLWSRRR